MIINAEKVRVEQNVNGVRIYTDEDVEKQVKELSSLSPGDIFTAGNRQFAVMKHLGDTTEVLEVGELERRVFDDDCNNWDKSELRNYLNTAVLKEYESLFGEENIIEDVTDLTSLDGLTDYGTCDDKIRLMTFEEYREYQDLFTREEQYEWLVTPWSTPKRGWEYAVCCVSADGLISSSCSNYSAVRPFCILKSNIFVSVEGK